MIFILAVLSGNCKNADEIFFKKRFFYMIKQELKN